LPALFGTLVAIFRGQARCLMAENFEPFVMPANVSPLPMAEQAKSHWQTAARAHHA
jgi:hypothetical protein